jgi:hypothetical protein
MKEALEHDPEKWKPVFPRDKREAFARRSCSNNKMTDEHDSTQLKHALVGRVGKAIGRANARPMALPTIQGNDGAEFVPAYRVTVGGIRLADDGHGIAGATDRSVVHQQVKLSAKLMVNGDNRAIDIADQAVADSDIGNFPVPA